MSDGFLRSKNIIKLLLIIFSSVFWIYFLISSKLTIDTLIIFDLISVFNSVLTFNFLFFLLFFPITSIIILSIGINTEIAESIKLILISMFFVTIVSFLLLRINFYFVFFLILYYISHIVIAIMVRNKSKDGYKNLYELATAHLSKLTIFLVIAIFIVGLFYIVPNQKQKAELMEAGIVNLFVSDDLGPWIDTSYTISAQCTKANLEYLKSSKQYLALDTKTDPESIAFTDLLNNLYTDSLKSKSTEELRELYPNLDSIEVKAKVIETIKSIPLMVIFENYFAIFFMLFLTSFFYTYLSIVYLFFALLIYVFNKILEEN